MIFSKKTFINFSSTEIQKNLHKVPANVTVRDVEHDALRLARDLSHWKNEDFSRWISRSWRRLRLDSFEMMRLQFFDKRGILGQEPKMQIRVLKESLQQAIEKQKKKNTKSQMLGSMFGKNTRVIDIDVENLDPESLADQLSDMLGGAGGQVEEKFGKYFG